MSQIICPSCQASDSKTVIRSVEVSGCRGASGHPGNFIKQLLRSICAKKFSKHPDNPCLDPPTHTYSTVSSLRYILKPLQMLVI